MRLFQNVVAAMGRRSSSVETISHPESRVLPRRNAGLRKASMEVMQMSAPTTHVLALDASKCGQVNAERTSYTPSAKLAY